MRYFLVEKSDSVDLIARLSCDGERDWVHDPINRCGYRILEVLYYKRKNSPFSQWAMNDENFVDIILPYDMSNLTGTTEIYKIEKSASDLPDGFYVK